MSYHTTNCSHVSDHFLSTLLSLRYMCCVACCWKSRLMLAVLYWKAPAASVSLSRQDAAAPPAAASAARSCPHVGPFYGASVYSCMYVVCSCSLFVRRSTCGSYRDILSDIVSYLSFSLMAVSCHHYIQPREMQHTYTCSAVSLQYLSYLFFI